MCDLDNNENYINYNLIIDFSSLKKLKELKCSICDFLLLKNPLLEKIKLYSNKYISKEIKMIEKILSIKTLKNIKFDLYKYDINEISKIQDENTSVLNVIINCRDQNKDLYLFNLQQKLPNLSNLCIFGHKPYSHDGIKLEITENPKCKTNIISLRRINRNIKLYIQSYESLKIISFYFDNEIINLKDSFPLFNNNSSIIFKSLTTFEFANYNHKGINYSILKIYIIILIICLI